MTRGPAHDDAALFGEAQLPALRTAVAEFAWLLERGYPETAALELVGNRHGLRTRQRTAVLRSTCTDAALAGRSDRRIDAKALAGRPLAIDGFNVLISLEVALAGGVLLRGRDGALRDLASVHGSYRRTAHTLAAAAAIGEHLAALAPASVQWWLDRPVSNSGRLAQALAELAASHGWAWEIELDHDPDRRLASFEGVVATSDAWILERARAHYDLAAAAVDRCCPNAWVLDLGLAGAGSPG
ncbi:hypothetical protein DB30_01713 [Enhygromyxa salina]|uniref:DUF434 domain-containing protein n=1 Tax=Enhygromyxa salina TaxID=215803 RepID=A0A0C1ZL18_9BACT|nr:DUF434 domain-containing protein [Enhygromyxa salina]KIG18209.1 hypothetical protein DB30_01713 [Enhygromyxa salina]